MHQPQTFVIETPDVFAKVRALRFELGKTGEQFGELIGLHKSKVSELESGKLPVTVAVALKIEALSVKDGRARIDASDLNEDVRCARAQCPGGCFLAQGQATGQANE